jgi:hypothetical protein
LGGHLHRAYVANSLDQLPAKEETPGILLVHAGTTTSRRGRARERNKNTFNLIGIAGERIVVTTHMYDDCRAGFFPVGTHGFPRNPLGFLGADPIMEEGPPSALAPGYEGEGR